MQAAAKSNVKDVALERWQIPIGGLCRCKSQEGGVMCSQIDHHQYVKRPLADIKNKADNTKDAGQICTDYSRVYVEQSVAEDFKKTLVAGFKALVQGDPSKSDTFPGPQADSVQAQSILRYFEIARQDGEVSVGGEVASDFGQNFIRPTRLSELPESSRANKEEIFGPVLVMHKFESEAEALQRANDTECEFLLRRCHLVDGKPMLVRRRALCVGLHERCQQSYESCSRVGGWQCRCEHSIPIWRVRVAFRGFKTPGIGRQKGSASLLAWTQEKSIFVDHSDD